MTDIDDMIADEEAESKKDNQDRSKPLEYVFPLTGSEETAANDYQEAPKVLVGKVEHFFEKINVAAIQLTGSLKIGDVIEIINDKGTTRLQISSMQINKENVEAASEGDDVGIKVDKPVAPGSKVYVMNLNLGNFRQKQAIY